MTRFCEPGRSISTAASAAAVCSFDADVPRSCKALCETDVEVIISDKRCFLPPWLQLPNAINPLPGFCWVQRVDALFSGRKHVNRDRYHGLLFLSSVTKRTPQSFETLQTRFSRFLLPEMFARSSMDHHACDILLLHHLVAIGAKAHLQAVRAA